MTGFVARKNAVVATLMTDFGISPLHASVVVNGWEYDASRRGIDQSTPDFWDIGRDWMVRQVAGTRPTQATTGHRQR